MKADCVREHMLDEVTKFFVGPRSKTDPLPEGNTPHDVYTSGILFPKNSPQEDMDEEDKKDADAAGKNSQNDEQTEKFFKQNSIGLRLEINKVDRITLSVNYGKYEITKDGIWERNELEQEKQTHELVLSDKKGEIKIKSRSGTDESQIWWSVHNDTVLNVFLENSATWAEHTDKSSEKSGQALTYNEATKQNNANSIFQPQITIRPYGSKNPFRPIKTDSSFYKSDEDDLFDMLYRKKTVFGIGYGCAAEWDDDANPTYVRTSLIPIFEDDEIAKFDDGGGDSVRPNKVDIFDLCCFDSLDDLPTNRDTIREKLAPMIEQYREWISMQDKSVHAKLEGEQYQELANVNLKKCSNVLSRIEDGFRLITDDREDGDGVILKAFVLANRAMLYQRLHFIYALNNFKNRKNSEWPNAKKPNQVFWYPFQIAFLLMSLRGIAFKDHKDRSTADLIWFPTGGGKTEAYLGLAAFTMILRRLRGDVEEGLGVSVIMRYTLRLLTLQQFERASTLICALEFLRRKIPDKCLGNRPFLLGLWVGYSLTPNHHEISEEALRQLKENPNISPPEGSPCQTNYCPWCGHRVAPHPNYRFDSKTKWTLVRCTNDSSRCIFTGRDFSPDKSLPLITVDSDIYTRCPSMIIATVDKFARLPFRPEIANIFGRPSRVCGTHGFLPRTKYSACSIEGEGMHRKQDKSVVRNILSVFPPDLIIQDELHLISGPLGTMVGLYETAVDFLTTVDRKEGRIGPKVIASTATIKGARDQVRKIFNRSNTVTFPPSGIDQSDSFFWWKTGKKEKWFVGISFSHRSGKYALAKLYASVLQKIQSLRTSEEIADSDIDPYWTLVGYYNSIRELGGSNRLVEDDVVQNMRFLADAVYHNPADVRSVGVPESGIEELTGRKTQREINEIRNKLEKSLPDPDVISVLLATNMISVGIDIDRLALMAINGQPKTVTEYIQAAGRVGRRKSSLGIVFVLFNPYKPRDMSHYENFRGFHSMMQKQVEQSTLTPFSIPACNRGLHAVLIAMIRLSQPRLAEKTSAADFIIDDGKAAQEFILERFKSVEQVGERSATYEAFKTKLKTILERWEKFIRDAEENYSPPHDTVWYNNPYDKWKTSEPNKNVLMIEFAKHGEQKDGDFPLSTPESLRDVEQQIEMEYV